MSLFFRSRHQSVCCFLQYWYMEMHYVKMSLFSSQLWKYALVAGLAVKMYRAIGSTTKVSRRFVRMDVLSGRRFVRTALDVLSGRRFVRTALDVLSGRTCLRRFVRKTFCQDRLRRFVRKTFCQDRLMGGHILGISLAYVRHISGISQAYLGHILGISLHWYRREVVKCRPWSEP